MDPGFLKLYEEELRFLRSAGAEFREQYPKIAGRLGLETQSCTDPYVERLLEGSAFLAARVQLKLRSRFPEFTHQLLQLVYPHLTTPVPSTGIVSFQPNWDEGALAAGLVLAAGTSVLAPRPRGQVTACRFRTAHDVTLWPLVLREAQYLRNPGMISAHGVGVSARSRAGLRLAFEVLGGANIGALALRRLPIHLAGPDGDDVPGRLYELLTAATEAVAIRSEGAKSTSCESGAIVRPLGFSREQALLPTTASVFDGYRLLQEYFTLPQRFLFAEVPVPLERVPEKTSTRFELFVLFDRADDRLADEVTADRFRLYSTPVINLFPQTADRIHLEAGSTDYHVVPDRNRPLDFEVHSVTRVTGISSRPGVVRAFDPMFAVDHLAVAEEPRAYFSVSRSPRIESSARRRRRATTAYLGSEVWISLHDPLADRFGSDLRQLELDLLCTNRGLTLEVLAAEGGAGYSLDSGEPVSEVRMIAGPTRPRMALHPADSAWRVISHLSLNYLSLAATGEGADSLRSLLGLYVDPLDREVARRASGVTHVATTPIVRRMPVRGPLCFGNGLEVRVRFDDEAFVGSSAYLLGSVLEAFFAKYVSLNSFTETVIETERRGEVHRWPARSGTRQLL